MKFIRSIAYGIVAVCIIGCLVILFYKGKDSETKTTSDYEILISTEAGDMTVSEIIEEIKEDVKETVTPDSTSTSASASTSTSVSASYKENDTGEISYSEIVRLQEEELLRQQKELVAQSNKEHGISVSSNDSKSSASTSASVKDYKYVVNKETKIVHRIGCLVAPSEDYAIYYEKLSEAIAAGYEHKCTVCSP